MRPSQYPEVLELKRKMHLSKAKWLASKKDLELSKHTSTDIVELMMQFRADQEKWSNALCEAGRKASIKIIKQRRGTPQ